MLIKFLLFVYLFCTYCFIFSTGSMFRIFLVAVSAVSTSSLLYIILGYAWYSLLYILVYVGGVYILFIYVSLVAPNSGLVTYRLSNLVSCANIIALLLITIFSFVSYDCVIGLVIEYSVYLCSYHEFSAYLFYCVLMLLGLALVNFIACGLISLHSNCVR